VQRWKKSHIKGNTFAHVIHQYLASPKFDGLADETKSYYRRLLAIAEIPDVLGARPVEEMRPALVQAFVDIFVGKYGTAKNALTAIKAVEKWAIVRDLIPYPITTGIEIEGEGGGHEPWTDEQVAYAEQHCRPDFARVIVLAANTGQRGSDLVRMRWSDIEEYEGRPGITVTQQKTGRQLWVPFTQELQAKIAAWERRPGFILLKPSGLPWSSRNELSVRWVQERERLGPSMANCVLHGLRGTACVRLLRAGAPTGLIAKMVGMSEQMVARYTRFAQQRDDALAAVIHLDDRRTAGEQRSTPRYLRPPGK
jgi:integrase